MFAWLLLLHIAVVGILAVAGSRLARWGFWVAAVPSAVTVLWGLTRVGDPAIATEVPWVPGLGLSFVFETGGLQSLMILVVSTVAVLVCTYSAGYFEPEDAGLGRFTPTLLAFTASMLGLVAAGSVWTMFVFWELTSVTSFLLVGHKHADPVARVAARRALVVTAAGGLVLLGGFAALVDATETDRFSAMGPVGSTPAAVAAVAVLVAAATKSAQLPFHPWLPGAMAAPTPVSAYLHSATMVKAGVILVAVLTPVLGGTQGWRPLALAFGLGSLVWGGVGALRHHDAKLILAWGTVSQLGFMISLLALGSGKAAFAAIAMITAHAAFKSALFMIVGEVDVRTGTRDIRRLDGLAREMPLAFLVTLLAAASMAGVPGVIGFSAKEAGVEAVLKLPAAEAWTFGVLMFGGMLLTVAYTTRFVVGVFGPGSGHGTTGPARQLMTIPSVVAAGAGVVLFLAAGWTDRVIGPAATAVDPSADVYRVVRWPGLTPALGVSLGILLLGAGLSRFRFGIGSAPAERGASVIDTTIDAVPPWSRRLVARIQHGSLPVYLVTMAVAITAAALPFIVGIRAVDLRFADSGPQAVLAALVVGAAAGAAAVRSRLGAALALGAVGIGVSGLFVAHGAPDLALTQLLVESVVVVGFVLGLGRLTHRFPKPGPAWRGVRLAVSAVVGITAALALAVAAGRPAGEAPLAKITERAVDEGGGNNLVNVILTDLRALDTLGEIVVLAVVALGVVALGRAPRTGDLS